MAKLVTATTTAEVTADEKPPEGYVPHREEGKGYLPPISRLKMPETLTQTAKIRWLFALGYEVKEISRGLNVRYQQVRNMVTTQPKRAAREDMPPLVITLLEMEDAVDLLLGIELERTHAEARKADRKKRGKPVESSEDAAGNEDVDDENYGRQ